MSSGLPSLNEILEEVRAEREGQNAHFDALDSKAGILLGFSGALVALTPTEDHLWVDVGRIAAVLAAALALWAFWPRRYSVTNLRILRDATSRPIPGSRRRPFWTRTSRWQSRSTRPSAGRCGE